MSVFNFTEKETDLQSIKQEEEGVTLPVLTCIFLATEETCCRIF